MKGKLSAFHLQRRAYVYLRQSTPNQVLNHVESSKSQYALAERAQALGWVPEAIEVIDEDLGQSGASAEGRRGFVRLAEAVAHGQAGAVLAIEVSRLARSSLDWQRLLALCAVAEVAVIDEQTIYDPNQRLRAGQMGAKDRFLHALPAGPRRRRHGRACGRCGQRMKPTYWSSAGYSYVCAGEHDQGGAMCWSVTGKAIDEAVEAHLLEAVAPDELELCLAVEGEVQAQAETLAEQWRVRIEQARYAARLAERRYMAVDPDNRVVARTLEGQWEAQLREFEEVQRRYEEARRTRHVELSEADRVQIRALARDLPAVWRAPTTAPSDRKAMLRLVIEAVSLQPVDVPARATRVDVQWHSGATTELSVRRPLRGEARRTPDGSVGRLAALAAERLDDEAIARRLNEEGVQSGSGRPWTVYAVRCARRKHGIERTAPDRPRRSPLPDRHPDGRYSVAGAARKYGVSTQVVRRWLQRGLVHGSRESYGAHRDAWWLDLDSAAERLEAEAERAARRRPSLPNNNQ